MLGRQVEFPKEQTHVKAFEWTMVALSIICAVVVLIIVLFTDAGNTFRPTL
jgi:hypothetical protein